MKRIKLSILASVIAATIFATSGCKMVESYKEFIIDGISNTPVSDYFSSDNLESFKVSSEFLYLNLRKFTTGSILSISLLFHNQVQRVLR